MTEPGDRCGLVLHLLGSGCALPDAARDTTSLLVGGPDGWTLVDCPGGVVHKLAGLGLRPADLCRVLLTHDHVDHVYGLPHLLHAMGLSGDVSRLRIHAPRSCLERIEAVLAAYGLPAADRGPELDLRVIEMAEGFVVQEGSGLRILAAPTEHSRDTVALRFEVEGASLVHSSDTRPSDEVRRLAAGTDLLLHDCSGPERLRESFAANHSSARDAATVASGAGAAALVLMHLAVADPAILQECLAEAGATFTGPVSLGRDGDRYVLGGDEGSE